MIACKDIQKFRFTEIGHSELRGIRAGAAPLAAAALVVAAAKLVLETSYYLGYAVGYIQGSLE